MALKKKKRFYFIRNILIPKGGSLEVKAEEAGS